ncbi:hypothetical protein D3C81_2048800 [compost metagenome]
MHMLMLFVAQVIPRHSVAKIHFFYNMQLAEQLQYPVHGGDTDFGGLLADQHVDLFRTQMVLFVLQQYPQGGVPLRGQLITLRR